MSKILIHNIHFLDNKATGYVVIDKDGLIEKIGPGNGDTPADKNITTKIDGMGCLLAPSFFDIRVTINNLLGADSLQRWSEVLFAGGVGRAVVVPSAKNPLDDAKSVRAFLSMAKNETRDSTLLPSATLHCYGAMSARRQGEQLTEYGLMGLAGALGFCDGNQNLTSAETFWRMLHYAKNFNALILAHSEDPSFNKDSVVMTSSLLSSQLGLPAAPRVSEALQLQRDIALVAQVGGRYHAGPITTKAGVDIIRQAKKDGLKITADTAPHYFALNQTAVGNYLTHAKLSPPLRAEEDRQGVIEGILDGTIDIIASDHKPLHDDKKRLPFVSAGVGMASVETMLPLMMTILHHEHKMPLSNMLATVTTAPLALFHLLKNPGAKEMVKVEGLLAPGQPADMVLLDNNKKWTIDSSQFYSPSKNTPFDGYVAQGRVMKTFKNGRLVFSR